MKPYGADLNAPKNSDCVACQNGWAIFVHPKTGVREHIDIFDTREAGISQLCPTQDPRWKVEED